MKCICTIKKLIEKLGEINDDNLYDVDIKKHKDKRSLNANNYMWVLVDKIADVLKSTKEEVYLQMLRRYGVFTYIVVKPEVVEKVKSEWRICEEIGDILINKKKGVQLLCYFGSSTYNTKEMARLIDGIVDECKTLNIKTLTPDEIKILEKEWKNECN